MFHVERSIWPGVHPASDLPDLPDPP